MIRTQRSVLEYTKENTLRRTTVLTTFGKSSLPEIITVETSASCILTMRNNNSKQRTLIRKRISTIDTGYVILELGEFYPLWKNSMGLIGAANQYWHNIAMNRMVNTLKRRHKSSSNQLN